MLASTGKIHTRKGKSMSQNEKKKKYVTYGKAYWWRDTYQRNEMSDKYQLRVGHLDDAVADFMEKQKLPVKRGDETYGNFIVFYSKNYPLRHVYDEEGQPVKPEDIPVGNGTDIKVGYSLYTYPPKKSGQTGVGGSITDVRILNMVEYESDLEEVEVGSPPEISDFIDPNAPLEGQSTPESQSTDSVDLDDEIPF